jgi:hypothetical protein
MTTAKTPQDQAPAPLLTAHWRLAILAAALEQETIKGNQPSQGG